MRALIESGLRHELSGVTPRKAAIRWVTVPGGLPRGMDVADRAKMIDRLLK